MVDFTAPASQRAIAALHEKETHELLLKLARYLVGPAQNEDLLVEAMLVVCDPHGGSPWDPARGSFEAHMRVVMRGLARNEWRRWEKQNIVPDGAAAQEVAPGNSAHQPEALLVEARLIDRLARLGAALRDRLAGSFAARVFDLGCRDDGGPAQLAERLGCDVGEVYVANRRIAREAARVLAEEARGRIEEEKRMRDPRAGGKAEGRP